MWHKLGGCQLIIYATLSFDILIDNSHKLQDPIALSYVATICRVYRSSTFEHMD